MALKYWVGGTGTWDQSSTTHWATSSGGSSGAAVPTASDDVIFDGNSGTGTVTISANAPVNSLASSGSSLHGITMNTNVTLTIGSGTAGNGNIAFDGSGFTIVTLNSGAALSFISTSSTVQTVRSFGGTNKVPSATFNGAGGSWQVNTQFDCAGTVTLTAGTLDTNNVNCTWLAYASTGSSTRTLTLGTSTITVFGSNVSPIWNQLSTGVTINASNSTISFSQLGVSSTTTVTLNTFTYGTVKFAGSAANLVTFSGSPTIGSLQMTGPLQVQCNASVTKTVTNFRAFGTSGNLVTLKSATGGTAFTISKSSGTVQCDYISLQDCTATGGATFYAGSHSTNVSGNTGWTFTDPPGTTPTASLTSAGSYGPTKTYPSKTAALSSSGSYGPTNTQAVRTGTISPSGQLFKLKPVILAAALSLAGLVTRAHVKILSAALSFATVLGHTYHVILAAVINIVNSGPPPSPTLYPSANLFPNGAPQFFIALARTLPSSFLTFSTQGPGQFTKTLARGLTGALTMAGTIVRIAQKVFVASLSLVAALVKKTARLVAASLPIGGAFAKAFIKILTGSLTSGGLISRATNKSLTAASTLSTAFIRKTSRALSGAQGMGGQISRASTYVITSALSMGGTVARTTAKTFTGVLSSSGSILPAFRKLFTASLSMAGTARHVAQKSLTANLTTAGSIVRRNVSKVWNVLLALSGTVVTQFNHTPPPHLMSLNANLSMAATVGSLGSAPQGLNIDVQNVDVILYPNVVPTITLYDGVLITNLPDLAFTLIDNNTVSAVPEVMSTK